MNQRDGSYPALSAVPSPRVTKAPSKFSATFWRPFSSVLEMSLAALPSCNDDVGEGQIEILQGGSPVRPG